MNTTASSLSQIANDTTNAQVRAEDEQIQTELREALQQLTSELGNKLKPADREKLQLEFRELDILLDRLKTGLVWVALFGKTSVGKSAITNQRRS